MKRGLIAGALMLAGCGADYGGLAIEIEGSTLAGDYVESRRMNLVLGHVVRVHARPRSLSAVVYEDSARFELSPADPTIVRTYRDPEEWRWVIVARGVGTSCIEVVIDGKVEECIEVNIGAEAG